MGNRANIYVEMPTGYGQNASKAGVYLYTHDSGHRWPEALREALEFGEGRWNDDQYLARIITTRVFHDLYDSEIGGGLSLTIGDNSYPIIVVDMEQMQVSFAGEGHEADPAARHDHMSFAEYVAQERADYPSKKS